MSTPKGTSVNRWPSDTNTVPECRDFFAQHVVSASPDLAALIMRQDWSGTVLGPPDTWSPIFRSMLELVLANRFPMVFWWGDQLLQFYNDAYRPMIGAKHPSSLGKPAQECWPEIWDTIGGQITSVYNGGPSTWNEDLFLEMNRHGFLEETYFTFSYSPLPDPATAKGIGGVLATVQETSKKVIRARNMTILRELAPIRSEVLSVEQECCLAVLTLQKYSKSVPFSLLYVVDADEEAANLIAAAGVEANSQACPGKILLKDNDTSPWALAYSRSFDDFYVVTNLDQLLEEVPSGPWLEPPREAVIIPIRLNRTSQSSAFLVAGCSSRLALDAEYRGFFALVGRQIAAAIARSQAQLLFWEMSERESDKLRSSEERFRTLASSMPHIVIECDANGVINYLSLEYERYTGRSIHSGFHFGWRKVVHPDDMAAMLQACRLSYRHRKSLRQELRLRRVDGMYRWHLAHILPQMGSDGQIVRWTGSVSDIDDQHRAAQERKILSDASQSLAQSLDLKTMMHAIAELAVKELCDWCEIDMLTPQEKIETYVLLHRDPKKQSIVEPLLGSVYSDQHADIGPPYVIRTGKTWLTNTLTPQFLQAATGERRAIYRQLGSQTVASVPMISQGQVLGAITLVCTDAQRTYSDDMLAMFEELGRRVGSATHNVRKFEQEHRIAESFQKASLSPALPLVPGVSFDAVYIPAASDLQVGGDWYDAVRLFDGRVVISIGDVTGHGLRAAVIMGNIRQIIRGIAQVHASPALILDAADRALRLESPDQIATAFVGVLDPITCEFLYASAGHPAPILRHADGSVHCLTDGGLPLGLRSQNDPSPGGSLLIPNHSKLVLYTDGLTESRRTPMVDEELLIRIVQSGKLFEHEHPAQVLYDTFLAGSPSSDDVAILIVDMNVHGTYANRRSNDIDRWSFNALDANAAQTARREFTAGLRWHGATEASINAAELVFGELVGNTARYAPGAVEVVVDWSVAEPVLHVLDAGKGYNYHPTLPRDIYSEAGRGLYIVSAFTREFHVEKRISGGSHARAVLSKML